MAENQGSNEDRTEEATPERRDEFREKGQIALSRDFASSLSLTVLIVALSKTWLTSATSIASFSKKIWMFERNWSPDLSNIGAILFDTIWVIFEVVIPVLLLVCFAAIFGVFLQTKMNFSWSKIEFDWSRVNPLSGISRIFSAQGIFELFKSIVKMIIISVVTYIVLYGAWGQLPTLMLKPFSYSFKFWGQLTRDLFYTILSLLLIMSGGDYLYQYLTIEKKLKMTKEEVKQEYKQREQDPHIKQRMKRMQRENIARSKVARTKTATVLITNPTHYSIALKYEMEYAAPVLVAKGIDDVALRMRIVAKDENIPIVENRVLARGLYAQVEEGEEIPSKFYSAVAEVIRHVYRLKGKKIRKKVTA